MSVDGDAERFRAQVEPIRAALLDLVAQTQAVRRDLGVLPAPESPAMREITEQAALAGRWGDHPVEEAHTIANLMVHAAEDLIHSLCRMYESGPPPAYGHVVLGRAAIESCARAAWLGDPHLGARRRVARSMSERLYSLHEASQLPGSPPRDDRQDIILTEAARLGFKKLTRKGRPPALDEPRPGATQAVRSLFSQDPDFGHMMYGVYSAIAHSTLYGLVLSLDHDPGEPDWASAGIVQAALVARTEDARTVHKAVGIAYTRTALSHQQLFGWDSPTWRMTTLNFVRLCRQM